VCPNNKTTQKNVEELLRQSSSDCLRTYNHPAHALWRAIELALLRQRMHYFQGEILDLGCGDGSFIRLLLGDQPTQGVDINKETLAKAAKLNPQSRVQKADVRELPFEEGRFDVVFSNCVLEHIPHLEKCIDEVGRVLKPGGVFIFTVPSDAMKHMDDINQRLEMINFFSTAEWRDCLGKRGMMIEEATGYLGSKAFKAWGSTFKRYETWRLGGVFLCALPYLLMPGGQRMYESAWTSRIIRLLEEDAPCRKVEKNFALLLVARKSSADGVKP